MAPKLVVLPALVAALMVGSSTATALYSTYNFNPLEHLGGVAPYFEPQDPPTTPQLPKGCRATRAAYLVRHAAIYANDYDWEEFIEPFVDKIGNKTGIDWSKVPSLSFLAGWKAPISDGELEMLTQVGKLEATQLGVSMNFRYPDIKLPSRVWASSAERTVKSAQSFARGLETKDNSVNVTAIYESEEGGADNLTPYKACPAYSSSAGSDQFEEYLDTFTKPIVARLNEAAPSFNFTANDVYGMMELCGYESVIRGSSPFCDLDLFTPDEWLDWEYAADIQYHYNSGYGGEVTGFVGLPWLNATAALLLEEGQGVDGDTAKNNSSSSSTTKQQGVEEDLYVSFTHRELVPMVIVAMGLFNNSDFGGSAASINQTMPTNRINHRRAWKSSHILPFLSNVAIEKFECEGSPGYDNGTYFRALVNSAPQELPGCDDGPATSCSAKGFAEYVQGRAEMFSGFSEKCGVEYKNTTDTLGFYEA